MRKTVLLRCVCSILYSDNAQSGQAHDRPGKRHAAKPVDDLPPTSLRVAFADWENPEGGIFKGATSAL